MSFTAGARTRASKSTSFLRRGYRRDSRGTSFNGARVSHVTHPEVTEKLQPRTTSRSGEVGHMADAKIAKQLD